MKFGGGEGGEHAAWKKEEEEKEEEEKKKKRDEERQRCCSSRVIFLTFFLVGAVVDPAATCEVLSVLGRLDICVLSQIPAPWYVRAACSPRKGWLNLNQAQSAWRVR